MDQITAILTDTKIPVGKTAKAIFDWLNAHAAFVFNAISKELDWLIGMILTVLEFPHPLVFTLLMVALTWALQRSWKTCLLILLGFLFVLNQGYWDEMMQSLTLVLSACVVCMAIGVPLGIAAAHRPRLYAWMRPVLDLMQTLPTFVYLIPAIVFFGIGMVPGLIATVIFVLPAPIRLTHLGIASTPTALVEAAPVLVSNNTGPVHVASAVGTPVVDLYALTNVQHTPWLVPHRVLYHDVPCRLCYKSVCPMGHHDCLRLVPPEAVADAAVELFEGGRAGTVPSFAFAGVRG